MKWISESIYIYVDGPLSFFCLRLIKYQNSLLPNWSGCGQWPDKIHDCPSDGQL